MTAKSIALIVDPDAASRDSLTRCLEGLGFRTLRASSGSEALEVFHRTHPSLVVLDVTTSDVPGPVLLRRFRGNTSNLTVLAMAADPDVRMAVEAMHDGAADFVEKSAAPEVLRHSIEGFLPDLRVEGVSRDTTAADGDYARLFHRSVAMRKLEARVIQVAQTDTAVLIEGERGVGQAEVAWAVHYLSARRDRPLVRLNCATLPADLLEGELFGREARTPDAGGQRQTGRLDAAHTGTLLLEDVGEVPAPLQLRLVRVLRGGEFFRVGGRELGTVDVRLIVTSRHVDSSPADQAVLGELDDELGALRLVVPPLRERREEIPHLIEHYRDRFSREFRRAAAPLSSGTVDVLGRYQWPGNVHELANVIKRYVVLGGERHLVDEIQGRMQVTGSSPARFRPGSPGGAPVDIESGLRQIARRAARDAERAVIEQVLTAVHWNRAEAARRLKVSYKTMLKKLGEDEFGGSRGGTRAQRGRARSA